MCFLFLDALFFFDVYSDVFSRFSTIDSRFARNTHISSQVYHFFGGKFPRFRCRRKREAVDDTFQALKEAVWWTRP